MGDKTQLLALVLATKFKKPWHVMAGILTATIANHLLAASVGATVSSYLPQATMRLVLAIIFWAFAIWILIPDKEDESEGSHKWGAFVTSTVLFFLAEMGDKTQLATVSVAAKFNSIWLVTVGTTLGMLFSDGLAVFFGDRILQVLPLKWLRVITALVFAGFGALIYMGL